MFDSRATGKWWDKGLNLVEGCTKVSPGCEHCWSLTAANMRRFNPNPKIAARYKNTVQYGRTSPDRTDSKSHFQGPAEWTGQVNPQWPDLDKIGRSRTPKCYTFWNDLFHPGVPEEFIDQVLLRIQQRAQHFYIICTKRPERALKIFTEGHVSPDAKKIWKLMLMTTAENQYWADIRIPQLLQIPGVLHGVNLEPLLAPISFRWAKWQEIKEGLNDEFDGLRHLDWVIAGGETGPRARPSHPDWFRSVRDQCQAAGVPFFFKGWGVWGAYTPEDEGDDHLLIRVGKKTAGRRLDGRTWDETPL